jgi:hypothetical protein
MVRVLLHPCYLKEDNPIRRSLLCMWPLRHRAVSCSGPATLRPPPSESTEHPAKRELQIEWRVRAEAGGRRGRRWSVE